jgi:hypothetical protein
MFLSDKDILAAVKTGDITLEPFNQKKLATSDVRHLPRQHVHH